MKKKIRVSLFFVFLSCLYTVSAQYATSGSGIYKAAVYWLPWQIQSDQNAAGLVSANCNAALSESTGGTVTNGTYIWNVVPGKIRIVGMISNLSGTLKTNNLQGGWSTGFNNMYSGASPWGIGAEWGTATFDIMLSAQYNQGSADNPQWNVIPNVPGMLIGDAESLSDTNGEYISASADVADSALGWEILAYDKGSLASVNSNYKVTATHSSSAYSIKLTSTNDARESAILFARGVSSLKNVTIIGAGAQYMTIGVLLPFDYGDAHLSYGSSPHFLSKIDNNGSTHILSDGTYIASSLAGTYTYAPYSNIWLGNQKPDADSGYQASNDALLDNTTGTNDEDGIVSKSFFSTSSNSIGLQVVANNTSNSSAYLYGWVDGNKNGIFELSELSYASIPANTTSYKAVLQFAQGNLSAGDSAFVRLRISTQKLTNMGVAASTNTAVDGEVEDYVIPFGYQVLVHAYNDGNGITDNSVYGGNLNTADTQLYAYLVDPDNGKIAAKAQVGSYSMGTALLTAPSAKAYNSIITNQNQDTGVVFLAFSSDSWVYSGSDKRVPDLFYGNNLYGGGTTVTSTDQIKVYPNTKTVKVGEVSYAFDKKPVASNKTFTFDANNIPTPGSVMALAANMDNGNNILGQLSGTDLEDGTLNGSSTSNVVIKSLPLFGTLLYKGDPVTTGQVISAYTTTDLSFRFDAGSYSNISFSYSFVDKAGVVSAPANYSIILSATLLPIELLNLTAKVQSGNVLIGWTTLSEINNKGFEVERSTDASTWNTIGFVNSKALNGSSNTELIYNCLDNSPIKGMDYYRLKQIDLDGKVTYSNVLSVDFSNDNIMHLYPNPTNGVLYLSGATVGTKIKIIGLNGSVLRIITMTNNPQQLNVSDLTSGVYIIQVLSKDGIQTLKFIKK